MLPRGPGHLKRRLPKPMAAPTWAAVSPALHDALAELFGQFVAAGERLAEAGRRLMTAIEAVLESGEGLTRDLGGEATTEEVTAAVCKRIEGRNR